MSCYSAKQSCGKLINANCVEYEGKLPLDSVLEDSCDVRASEIIEELVEAVDAVKAELDHSDLGNLCMTYPTDFKQKDLNEAFETKLCELEGNQDSTGIGSVAHCGLDLTGLVTGCEDNSSLQNTCVFLQFLVDKIKSLTNEVEVLKNG